MFILLKYFSLETLTFLTSESRCKVTHFQRIVQQFLPTLVRCSHLICVMMNYAINNALKPWFSHAFFVTLHYGNNNQNIRSHGACPALFPHHLSSRCLGEAAPLYAGLSRPDRNPQYRPSLVPPLRGGHHLRLPRPSVASSFTPTP